VKQEIKTCREVQTLAETMQKDIDEAERQDTLEGKNYQEKDHVRQEQR